MNGNLPPHPKRPKANNLLHVHLAPISISKADRKHPPITDKQISWTEFHVSHVVLFRSLLDLGS